MHHFYLVNSVLVYLLLTVDEVFFVCHCCQVPPAVALQKKTAGNAHLAKEPRPPRVDGKRGERAEQEGACCVAELKISVNCLLMLVTEMSLLFSEMGVHSKKKKCSVVAAFVSLVGVWWCRQII